MSIEIYALEELTFPPVGIRQLGLLRTFEKASFTERDLGVGSWSIEFPLPDAGAVAQYWRTVDFPAIEVVDTETGWRYAGYVTEIKTIKRRGERRMIVSGVDYMAEMQFRLALPNPDQPLDHWVTNLYGQWEVLNASWDLINENMVTSADGRRRFYMLTLDPWVPADPLPSPQFQVEGQPILDMVRRFCEGTPYTVRFGLDRSTPDAPVIRGRLYQRPTNRRVILVDQAKADEVVVSERAATATDVILMGEQSAPPADPRWVFRAANPNSAAVPPSWRQRVREKFFNRPSTGLDSIEAEATALARAEDTKTLVSIKGLDVDSFGFGVEVGDIIKVNLGEDWDGQVVDIPIVASTLTIDDDGAKRSVDVGDFEAQGPSGVYRDLQQLSRKVGRIEDKAHQ